MGGMTMKRLAILLITLLLFGSTVRAETATASLQEMYAQAELLMVQGDYVGAAAKFEALSAYSDAAQMTLYCKAIYAADMGMYEMAVDALSSMGQFKDAPQLARYYTACSFLNCAETGNSMQMVDYEKYMQLWSESLIQSIKDPSYEAESWDLVCCYWAKAIFTELALYKDSMMKVAVCDTLIQQKLEAKAAAEEAEKEQKYQEALAKESEGDYQAAANIYYTLWNYKDCEEKYSSCLTAIEVAEKEKKYQSALAKKDAGHYEKAYMIFIELGEYRDSRTLADACKDMVCANSVLIKTNERAYYYTTGGLSSEASYLYSYDENNHLISIERVSDLPYKEEYTLDDNGQIIQGQESGKWSSDERRTYVSTIEYNEFGDPIKRVTTYNSYDNWLYKDGQVNTTIIEYSYNDNGEILTEKKFVNQKQAYSYTYKYDYNDNNQVISKTLFSENEPRLHYAYHYNTFGLLEKVVRESVNADKTSSIAVYTETTYTYGNL